MKDKIFDINSEEEFEELALEIFQYQYVNNLVYRRFCNLLGVSKTSVKHCAQIPFLPIDFFKKEKVLSTTTEIQKLFTSSGTTGNTTSKHYITDLKIYEKSFRKAFTHFFGEIDNYCVLALLPSYLEREGSSLIYMTADLIEKSKHPSSNFYLHNTDELINTLEKLEKQKQPTLLLGVTYALLDVIEKQNFKLKYTTVMETGGMKGQRKEIIREELHQVLSKGFGIKNICSEYGMTELLSQAYSKENGIFECPPWMKIMIRDTENPLRILPNHSSGGVNVIDLANIESCSFIATQDLGKKINDCQFEILGRFDHSDIRGCNLMVL